MDLSGQLVVFTLEGQRYGLRMSVVERVVRAVEVTPLPAAPGIVLGVINVEGRIIPVVDIRERFRLPEKEIGLSDYLIIAETARRTVAFPADSVSGVVEVPDDEIVHAMQILPQVEYLEGIAKLEGGMVLIHDLDRFLSLDEEKALDTALTSAPEFSTRDE
jgi:purine-binding chemotaxis protein CheW